MLFPPNGWHFSVGSCKVFNGFVRKWHLHLPGASPNHGDGEEAPPSELSSWWLADINLKTPCVTSQDVTRTSDWKQSGTRARCVWSLMDHADHAGVWRFHSVLENLIFSDMIADSWRCWRRKGVRRIPWIYRVSGISRNAHCSCSFGHRMDSRWLKTPTPQMHNKAPESRNRKLIRMTGQ